MNAGWFEFDAVGRSRPGKAWKHELPWSVPGLRERQDSGWARQRPMPQRGWQARLDPVLKVVGEFRTRQTASCHDSDAGGSKTSNPHGADRSLHACSKGERVIRIAAPVELGVIGIEVNSQAQ